MSMRMRDWQRAIRDIDSSFCCGAEGVEMEKTMVVVWGKRRESSKKLIFTNRRTLQVNQTYQSDFHSVYY